MARTEDRRVALAAKQELHRLLQSVVVEGGIRVGSLYSSSSIRQPRPISYQNQPVTQEKRDQLEKLYQKVASVNGRRKRYFNAKASELQMELVKQEQGKDGRVMRLTKEDCRKLSIAGCTRLTSATDHFAVTHNLLPRPSLGEPDTAIPVHAKELLCSFLDNFDLPSASEMLMLMRALRLPEATIGRFLSAKQECDKTLRQGSAVLTVRSYALRAHMHTVWTQQQVFVEPALVEEMD